MEPPTPNNGGRCVRRNSRLVAMASDTRVHSPCRRVRHRVLQAPQGGLVGHAANGAGDARRTRRRADQIEGATPGTVAGRRGRGGQALLACCRQEDLLPRDAHQTFGDGIFPDGQVEESARRLSARTLTVARHCAAAFLRRAVTGVSNLPVKKSSASEVATWRTIDGDSARSMDACFGRRGFLACAAPRWYRDDLAQQPQRWEGDRVTAAGADPGLGGVCRF